MQVPALRRWRTGTATSRREANGAAWRASPGPWTRVGLPSVSAPRACALKGRRSVDPQHPGLGAARVFPTMWRSALEVEAVTRLELVFLFFQRNVQFALQDVEKLFSLVSVRFAAAGLRSDAEQVRLHDGIAPGQEFHANTGPRFQHFALLRRHHSAVGFRRIKKIEDVGFVEARQLTQCGHRGAHVRTLESAEESQRNAHRLGHMGQRKPVFGTQLAQANADGAGGAIWGGT